MSAGHTKFRNEALLSIKREGRATGALRRNMHAVNIFRVQEKIEGKEDAQRKNFIKHANER